MKLTAEQQKALDALDCQTLFKGLLDKFLAGLISSICPQQAKEEAKSE